MIVDQDKIKAILDEKIAEVKEESKAEEKKEVKTEELPATETPKEENKEEVKAEPKPEEKQESTDTKKSEELEKLYSQKLSTLAEKEKQLEPLLQLQQFLQDNPDKAQQIADILLNDGKVKDDKKEEQPKEEDPFVEADPKKEVNAEILKLQSQIKDIQTQLQHKVKEEKITADQAVVKQRIDGYVKQYGEDFDIEKYFGRLLAYPEDKLNKMSDSEFEQLSEATAKKIVEENKLKFETKHQKYLSEKKEIAKKTASETKQSLPPREKSETKVSLIDGSAKKAAIDMLNKMSSGA